MPSQLTAHRTVFQVPCHPLGQVLQVETGGKQENHMVAPRLSRRGLFMYVADEEGGERWGVFWDIHLVGYPEEGCERQRQP